MCRLMMRYPLRTMTSHVSIDIGKLNLPRPGVMCQKRSGLPMSTVTKRRHMIIAATARSSPTSTTLCICLS